jgi:hypothetical protein
MEDTLFWVYLVNSVFLINHEIDSACWKEWEIFRLPGGRSGFLIIHFPLLFLILYSLVPVHRGSPAGPFVSLVVSMGGMFAFLIHFYLISRRRSEFRTATSLFILTGTFVLSIIQAFLTVNLIRQC